MDPVQVWRGKFGDPVPLFGPLPGVRAGGVVAYEFELPERFEPWPGRTLLERVFVLTDVGVSMSQPCWRAVTAAGGEVRPGLDAATTWYVDLVHLTGRGGEIIVRDLYADVIVAADGRHQRMLDLDDFADAIEDGTLPVEVAVDGLRRWQRFQDRHLHTARNPRHDWSDFPPAAIAPLAALPGPLGPVVTWQG
jgi:Protein of unknown function (DUF402)